MTTNSNVPAASPTAAGSRPGADSRLGADSPLSSLQLRSLVRKSGELELSLVRVAIPELSGGEVLLRVEASPLNPSDIGLLFGAADLSTVKVAGTAGSPIVTAQIPERSMSSMAGRVEVSMPVGNEGAGMVVKAGASGSAQALLGKAVAVLGGAMYSQYRCVPAEHCLVLPEGMTPADGAAAFVNPLTALGMVETMRREGHSALVHTAAASSLGHMLNRICIQDQVALVNIVRRPEQERQLRAMGAVYVCDSSSATFMRDLTEALVATGATIAFDATGGGRLAGHILSCMEAAVTRDATEYSRYGSMIHKQVYIYGGLEGGPTEFNRDFGMSWGMGGWLLNQFLKKIGPAGLKALTTRIAGGLKTTFASHYSQELSLPEALQRDAIAAYSRRATGGKYLINPNKNVVA